MTLEILELMNERRKAKNNIRTYKKLVREARKSCQRAKEIVLNNQCQETEELEKKNTQLMHIKIKEAIRNCKTSSSADWIEANDGKSTWEKKSYVKDGRNIFVSYLKMTGYQNISYEEKRGKFGYITKKQSKAYQKGTQQIHMRYILSSFKPLIIGADWMTKITNRIYDEGHSQKDMSRSTFITLPKKAGTTEHHRTVSFMSHRSRLF